MTEKELAEFIARLPAHLRFFFEPPSKDLEAEEMVERARKHFAKVRQHREELMAHGIGVDRYLADAEPKIEELVKANEVVDTKENELLHAQADRADLEFALFKELKQKLEQLEEENPFDPRVQEWREQLDELAKRFPKE